MQDLRQEQDIAFRPVVDADAPQASRLVQRSFSELAGPDWSPEARAAFLEGSLPSALAGKIRDATYSAGAFQGERMLGFLLMTTPRLLGMLFVEPAAVRRGIGRSLWELARANLEAFHPEVKTVELNTTPYAFQFYRSLGFVALSREFVIDGCRATRMACWLPGRSLQAELAPGDRTREAG